MQGYQRLGELLVAHEAISDTELSAALKQQKVTNQRLGEILVELGYVSERTIATCLADQYGYEVVDPALLHPMRDALACLEPDEAVQHLVLPVTIDDAELFCVVADPLNILITDELRQRRRRIIRVAVSPATDLLATIRRCYDLSGPQDRAELLSQVPPRYGNALPRAESGRVLILESVDNNLDRRVTLFRVPIKSDEERAHLSLVRAAAQVSFPGLCRIYDSVTDDKFRWTMIESIPGETLVSDLRFRGKRTAVQAAEIVQAAAKATDLLPGSWICPENIWVDSHSVYFAPVVPPTGAYAQTDTVKTLGYLLWQCLVGKFEERVDPDLAAALGIPEGMVTILQRCQVSSGAQRFSSPAEVASELGSFHWAGASNGFKQSSTADREELLATLKVATPTSRPSFWQKLFGRKAA